ncbi:MAG TPA: hypothetical protein VN031_03170 [Candidatus Microsaccharimonas sp.]|nr:hypothetical protein [Candidatus Microsaccharimonas sp.]
MAQGEQKPESSGGFSDSLDERVAYWQHELALVAGTDELKHVKARAVNACNELLEHQGSVCTFNGNGVYPVVNQHAAVTVAAGDISGQGFDRGFSVHDFLNNDNPRLYRTFFLGSFKVTPHPVAPRNVELMAFLAPDCSVIPNYEVDAALLPQTPELADRPLDFGDLFDGIYEDSHKFRRVLASRKFRKLDLTQQRTAIDSFVSRSEQRYDVRDMGIMIEDAQYCCRVDQEATNGYEFIDLNGTTIEGVVLGLGSLERNRLNSAPIRQTRDLVSHAAGLCLLMHIESATDPTGLSAGDIIALPTADQEFELAFQMHTKTLDLSKWFRAVSQSGGEDSGAGEMAG